jgi:hypothetical protein
LIWDRNELSTKLELRPLSEREEKNAFIMLRDRAKIGDSGGPIDLKLLAELRPDA